MVLSPMTNFFMITATYCLLALISTVFWANHFTDYRTYKGDEFFFFAEYLLGLTIVFYLVLFFFIKRLKYLFILLLPFSTIFTSFIFGLGFLAFAPRRGTPVEIIYIYGFTYILINSLLSILLFAVFKAKEPHTTSTEKSLS